LVTGAACDQAERIERFVEQDRMMTPASLDDLAAFAALGRTRSFTRAAATLGTSTSNLSHTIRRLEARLRYRQLQRNIRSVAATEAGEMLLATLGPALESIDAALDALDLGRDRVAGTLRLTATRQAYGAVVRPMLPAFIAAHPDATVEVLIDYAYRDIVANRFDAGIRLGEKLERDMIALRVGPELSMAVVATPDYLACSGPLDHPSDLMCTAALTTG
jgi:DNA-binding transcriptional LysR family regulator